MLLMVVHALVQAVLLVMSKLLMEWPFYRMMAVGNIASIIGIAIVIAVVQPPLPEARKWKWVFLRGLFSILPFALMASALRVGASTGDVASLSSVNTFVAALLGRILLGEPLKCVHVIAIGCCVLGVMLISRPTFIFGGSGGDAPLSGYILAILGGFSMACVAISTRKAGTTSLWYLNFSVVILNSIACMVLPYTPLLEDASLTPLVDSPWEAAVWTGVIFVLSNFATAAMSGGCKLCPAAVSATVGTAARMVWGYAAQSIVFKQPLDFLTVCGAVTMLAGVFIMTIARLPARQSKTLPVTDFSDLQAKPEENVDASYDDDNESLASFIAAEFVEVAAHDFKPVRQRRRITSEAIVDTIGAMTAVIPSIA